VYNAHLLRHKAEYALARLILEFVGRLPRPLARRVASFTAYLLYWLVPRWRRVAYRNLNLAMPELGRAERRRIVRGVYQSLGRMLAEFARFPCYTPQNIRQVAIYDGFENYAAAVRRGRGVLFLTGHLGAWELGAFAHSVYGYPISVLIRALDNPYLNALVNRYRTLAGNRIIEKRDFLRGILQALKNNETVGILMDQNSSLQEGAFVQFFGWPACSSAGMAKIALRTDAVVVPAFTIWDAERQRYRIRFDPPLELSRSGDAQADIVANTQLFTTVLETYIRRYPDQWLWIHRRWKTRPPGEPPLY
jgi:KDO2-lipid IV(A) lauroyltransferase